MSMLRKILGKKEEPDSGQEPFWAANFEPYQYRRFLRLVSAYFHKKEKPHRIENGEVILLEPHVSQRLNLQNIAQKCRESTLLQWPVLIQNYFDHVIQMQNDPAAYSGVKQAFEQIRPHLGVRIWPDGKLDSSGRDNLIYRVDLPGTITVLVLDQPDTIDIINPKMIEKWGVKAEELFEIGLRNILRLCRPQRHIEDLGQGVKVTVLSSDSFFAASYALLLDELFELSGEYGLLFGIPNRQTLVCYPVVDMFVLQAVNQMVPAVHRMFREGPGSVSPHLYWYCLDNYSVFKFNARKKTLLVPEAFEELLDWLEEQSDNPVKE